MILRSSHLLEQNSGKVYFLGYWFMIKGYNCQMEEIHGAEQSEEGVWSPCALAGLQFPHLPAFSSQEASLDLSFRDSVEVPLLGTLLLTQCLALLYSTEDGE